MNGCSQSIAYKQLLPTDLQTLLKQLVDSQNKDIALILIETSRILAYNNHEILQLRDQKAALSYQVEDYVKQHQDEEQYKKTIMDKSGMTDKFKKLNKDMNEYDKMKGFLLNKEEMKSN